MTVGQILSIIVATMAAILVILALAPVDFTHVFRDWRLRLATAIVALCVAVSGVWAVDYYAARPKTLVETSREVAERGSEKAKTTWLKTRDWIVDTFRLHETDKK